MDDFSHICVGAIPSAGVATGSREAPSDRASQATCILGLVLGYSRHSTLPLCLSTRWTMARFQSA